MTDSELTAAVEKARAGSLGMYDGYVALAALSMRAHEVGGATFERVNGIQNAARREVVRVGVECDATESTARQNRRVVRAWRLMGEKV